MKKIEIWKTVQGYGQCYEASNLGNIRSKDRIVLKNHYVTKAPMKQFYKGRILKQFDNGHGYKLVRFGVDGKKYSSQVGRMILLAFKGEPKKDEICCHNNSDPHDNRIENLRWGNQKDNMKDRLARGKYLSCEDHFMSKLTNKQVLEIYNSNETGRVLAKRFNTSENTITKIRKGILWNKVTGGKDRGAGSFYIGKRPNDKLTMEIAKAIRLDKESGLPIYKIADKYNITWDNASQVVKRKTWKD